jgi:hypothetical protein
MCYNFLATMAELGFAKGQLFNAIPQDTKQEALLNMENRPRCNVIRILVLIISPLLIGSCAPISEITTEVGPTLSTPGLNESSIAATPSLTLTVMPTAPTPTPASMETPALDPDQYQGSDCASVEHLSPDSVEAQQIREEFVANYKEQYPTEYMGMAVLHRVDRLGEWAVITGSIAGEGKDVIAVRLTPQGYQIVEFIHIVPLELPEELEMRVIQPFLERLPEAPPALFTCLDQAWLLASGYRSEPSGVYQLAYVSTDDYTTEV